MHGAEPAGRTDAGRPHDNDATMVRQRELDALIQRLEDGTNVHDGSKRHQAQDVGAVGHLQRAAFRRSHGGDVHGVWQLSPELLHVHVSTRRRN